MNKFLILLLALVIFSNKGQAQVDSIHFQFQDTLLKAGTDHTFLITVREDLSEMLGFQFCIKFDDENINFKEVGTIYLPDLSTDNINAYPLGNPDLIAVALDVISVPYTGNKLLELEFHVIKDCRVRDVIQILTAYRFKEDESYSFSEVFFDVETLPIATEYLPFSISAIKDINIISSSVYPNPSYGKVKLDFKYSGKLTAPLTVYDALGKVVNRTEVQISSGNNTLELERNLFGAAGNYVVKVELGNKIINAKVTIIN